MPWEYDRLQPVDLHELEVAFWWRWRRQCDMTRTAIVAALDPDSARSIDQSFFILDNGD